MKALLSIALLALITGAARADWKDLKPGMDRNAAAVAAGMPLMENRGKGGAEVWTYDSQGFIQFQSGRVIYWEKSKPAEPKPVIAAKPAPVGTNLVATLKVLGAKTVVVKN